MEKTMNIKELHKKLSIIPDILKSWEEIIIIKNSKPSFKIVPLEYNEKKYSLKDFKKLQSLTWKKEDKHISKNIDKYLYN